MSIRVLIVDDHEGWRRTVRELLRERPELQVIGEASDGLEAVQKAAELKPNLIVLDIGLPKLNGIEFSSLSTMALEPSGSAFFRFEGKYDLLLTERDREACSPAQ